MTRISAALRYTAGRIRNPMLYPAELRARTRNTAGFGSFRATRRQPPSGTQRKQRSQCGTLSTQCLTQCGPETRLAPRPGPDHNAKEPRDG